MLLIWLGLGLLISVGIIDGVCYGGLTPLAPPIGRRNHRRRSLLSPVVGDKSVATGLHALAYGLALLRLPFGMLPYLAKASLYFWLGPKFAGWWQWLPTQALRWLGDVGNWIVTALLLWMVTAEAPFWITSLSNAAIGAEMARLILEKGQMWVSAIWQQLPHRRFANWLRVSAFQRWCRPYTFYYGLSDMARLDYVRRLLRRWARVDQEVAAKLRYVRGFRIVDARQDLRTGHVRDVARGEIFVHARWSNDPWLLIGQALRRSPWLFDPRYLRRPFYYRTEANPRATRFVLENAHYSPPFALYQLGHEIKVARFELFYRLGRALGFNLEAPVRADGSYQFDPGLTWLAKFLGRKSLSQAWPLWNDADVLAKVAQNPELTGLSDEELAARFTYPLIYVEEVLRQAVTNASATTSGTSQ